VRFEDLDLPGGPFEVHEVYFDHDGPRLLALRAERWPMFYMLNCVEEDDDESTLTYLAVVLDRTRFASVRGGALDLRSAYVEARTGDVFEVVWHFDEETLTATPVVGAMDREVPEHWLPRPGASLSLPTDTAEPFRESELGVLGESGLRSVGAIELGQANEPLTEFSFRALSLIGSSIQDNVDALADEGYEGRANKPSEEVQLAVLGLRAASFVVLVGTDKQGRLTERTELFSSVFDELMRLVAAGRELDSGELLERLSGHNRRTRNRFKQLLKRLVDAESGLTIHSTPLGGSTQSAGLTYRQVRETLDAVSNVPDEVREVAVSRGALMALNLTRRTFEIHDLATMRRYSGHMSDDARSQADGLRVSETSLVSATLKTVEEFASEDDRTRCTLLEIRARD
jgi:hypothetical protein